MDSGMKMIDPTVDVAIIEKYKLAYMMQFFVQHKRRFRFSKIRLQDLYHRIIRDKDTTPLCDIVARIIRHLKNNDNQITMANVDSALDAFVLEKRTNYRLNIQRIRNSRPLHDLTPENRAKLLENLIECIYDDVPDFNFATDFNKKSSCDADDMMLKAGQDSKGCSYYYMDDLRLYRERPQSSIISDWDVVVGPSREQWSNFIESLSQTEEEGDLRAFLSESLLDVVASDLQGNMLQIPNAELDSAYLRNKEAVELKEFRRKQVGDVQIKEEGPTSVPSQSEPDTWKHTTPGSAGPAINSQSESCKPATPATPVLSSPKPEPSPGGVNQPPVSSQASMMQQQQPGYNMPPMHEHQYSQQQQHNMQHGIPPGYNQYSGPQGNPYQASMQIPPHTMSQPRGYPGQHPQPPPQQQVLVFNTAMANEAAVQNVSLAQYHQHHPLVRKFISDQKMMMEGGPHWQGGHPQHNMLHKPNESLTQEQLENRKLKMAELERIQSSFSKRSNPNVGGPPNQGPHMMELGMPDCTNYSQQQYNDAKREWHRLRIEFLKEKDQKAVDDIYRQRPAGPPMDHYPGGYPPPRPAPPYYNNHPAAHRRMAPAHPGMMQSMDPHGQKRSYPGYPSGAPPHMMPRPPYETPGPLPPPQIPVSAPPAPLPVTSAPTTTKSTTSKRRKTSKAAQQAAAAAAQQSEEVKSEPSTTLDPASMVRSSSDSALAPPFMPAIDGQELTITRQYNAAFQENVENGKQHGYPGNNPRGPAQMPHHYPQQPPAYSMAGGYPSTGVVPCSASSGPPQSTNNSTACGAQQPSKVPQNLTSASLASLARLSNQMPGPVGPFTSIQDQHHDLPAHSQPPPQQQPPSIQVNNTFVNAQLNVQQMNYQHVNGPGVSSQMQIQQHVTQQQQSSGPGSTSSQQQQSSVPISGACPQQTTTAPSPANNNNGHYGNASVQIQTKTPHTIQYLPAEPNGAGGVSGSQQQQPGGGGVPSQVPQQQPPRGKMQPEYLGPPAPSYPTEMDHRKQHPYMPPYQQGIPMHPGQQRSMSMPSMEMSGGYSTGPDPHQHQQQASQQYQSHQMMQQSQIMSSGGVAGQPGSMIMHQHQQHMHMQYMQQTSQTRPGYAPEWPPDPAGGSGPPQPMGYPAQGPPQQQSLDQHAYHYYQNPGPQHMVRGTPGGPMQPGGPTPNMRQAPSLGPQQPKGI